MQRLIQDLVSSIESNAVGKDISDDEKRTRSGKCVSDKSSGNHRDEEHTCRGNKAGSSLNDSADNLESSSSSGSETTGGSRGLYAV
jgi:hypothetical protein